MTTTTINGQKLDLSELRRIGRYAEATFQLHLICASAAAGPYREARIAVQAMRDAADEVEQDIADGKIPIGEEGWQAALDQAQAT
jgi:hypothetical protein